MAGFMAVFAGCRGAERRVNLDSQAAPRVVTADIQAGIEQHIEEQTRLGGGYFTIPYEGEELRLKLVRVHTYYLANLGPRWHFACVDLANIDGNVYDVDFFLEGDPGAMRVTETMVHKRNGQPFYVWGEEPDGTWKRSPVETASNALLGVIEPSDSFEFVYEATLPELQSAARMWIPLPGSDKFQTVKVESISVPGRRETLTEQRHGNKILFLSLGPEDSGKTLALRFRVDRKEKGPYRDPASRPEEFLAPEHLVPSDPEFSAIASEVVAGKQGELVRARALYDHTIDRMRYMKYGPGWGQGDAAYACDAGTGNCTDFHSYFIALSRAAGIPARFAIGASIPSERNDGGIDGYHCWAEFYAEEKWWPVDISEADKYSALSSYYFGRHPANRVELSRGRDLVVEPGPAAGPINFLAYPVLEVAGKPVPIKPQFSFRRGTRHAQLVD
jgi:transglutaminase-like putative cysteine protease